MKPPAKPPTGFDRRGHRSGFTLIEALMVLVILAMTVSIAAPLLRGPSEALRLDTVTSRVAAALRSTRAAAMARSQEMNFSVEENGRAFSSPVVPREVPSFDAALEIAAEPAGPPGEQDATAIRFFADGSSSGGTILIRTKALRSTLEVDALSGRTRVQQ